MITIFHRLIFMTILKMYGFGDFLLRSSYLFYCMINLFILYSTELLNSFISIICILHLDGGFMSNFFLLHYYLFVFRLFI